MPFPKPGDAKGCFPLTSIRSFDTLPSAFLQCEACFVAPALYTYGNAARDLPFGPGTTEFDRAVVKNTLLSERLNLQFRAEAFNAFNTPNFAVNGPNEAIGSPAGVITGTNIDNR